MGFTDTAPHSVSYQKLEKFGILISEEWKVIHNPYATSPPITSKYGSCIRQYSFWAIRTVRHQAHENMPVIHLSCPRGRGSHPITRHICPLLVLLRVLGDPAYLSAALAPVQLLPLRKLTLSVSRLPVLTWRSSVQRPAEIHLIPLPKGLKKGFRSHPER